MPREVTLGLSRLLPTGRICRPILETTPPLFVDTEGRICCRHGEHFHFLNRTAKQRAKETAAGDDALTSGCNCSELTGMLVKYNIPEAERPTKPQDRRALFDFLAAMPPELAHDRATQNGHIQLRAAAFSAAKPGGRGPEMWVRDDGAFVCGHGTLFSKLKKCVALRKSGHAQSIRNDCGCTPSILKRRGSALGKLKSTTCVKSNPRAALIEFDSESDPDSSP